MCCLHAASLRAWSEAAESRTHGGKLRTVGMGMGMSCARTPAESRCSRSGTGQVSRPFSDGLEAHMAAVHPISLWKQVPRHGGCSSITAWVSPSPRAANVDPTACCHHLCGCGGSRSSSPPPCCSLPLGLLLALWQIPDPCGKPAACAIPATAPGHSGEEQ